MTFQKPTPTTAANSDGAFSHPNIREQTFDDYQIRAGQTAIYPGREVGGGLAYLGLKLTGEAGEVSEKIGKLISSGKIKLDDGGSIRALSVDEVTAIARELGDVLWYISELANQIGFDLSEIARMNLSKLDDRHQRGVLDGSGDDR